MASLDDVLGGIRDEPVLQGLEPTQVQAVILAYLAVVHADRKVLPAELHEFELQLFELPWTQDRFSMFGDLIAEAAKTAEETAASGEFGALAQQIAQELPAYEVRDRVLCMGVEIAMSDGELHRNERALLEAMAQAFEIPASRIDAVIESMDDL